MRIGIDVQSTLGKKTGLGYYTKKLVENILKIDKENDYVLISNNADKDLRTPQRVIWDQVNVPIRAFAKGIRLLHTPAFSPPLARTCRSIVTLHDVIGMKFKDSVYKFSGWYWGRFLPYTVKCADRVITDSEYSKKDIAETLKINEDKIDVIYLAPVLEHENVTDAERITKVREKYRIEGELILYVGGVELRRNVQGLMTAFNKIREELQTRYSLVIVGKIVAKFKQIHDLHNFSAYKNDIIFTGYIDKSDLDVLYSIAKVFVYPSLYEGFGLPVLEAMSCGTPVATSNVTSLPEVAGDAGVLFDPTSADDMAEKITSILKDENFRQELIRRGKWRVAEFSWEKTARETIASYKRCLDG